jgi:hypothetical protein
MERCPECRARLKGRVACGRCEADLGMVYTIESQADILSRRALKALLVGDLQKATMQAVDARQLHATPFHRALAGFLENLSE